MTKMLLPLNLQFFAEDGGGAGGEGGGDGDWLDNYYSDKDKEGKGDKGNENMIPKSRFDSVNSKYKDLLDSSKSKQTEYDDMVKQLEEHGNTAKTLQETIDAGGKRVEALEIVIKGMLDAELEQIDADYHELVPSDKPIEEQLDWLRKAKSKGMFGSKGYEFEIGQPSNPRNSGKAGRADGMNPLQMLSMGYSNK